MIKQRHGIALIVAFALGGALAYALFWPRSPRRASPPGAPTAPHAVGSTPRTIQDDTTRDRLVLPGWEDLTVGGHPPRDAMQRCEPVSPSDDGVRRLDCRGCRSANLALPCISVLLNDGIAWNISAELPSGDERVTDALAALRTAWGTPSKHLRNETIDSDCWYSPRDHASYNAFKYDLSGVDLQDPNARVPRAQHPTRTVMIVARNLIDTCDPAGTCREEFESCMLAHCNSELSSTSRCKQRLPEGEELRSFCKDEATTVDRCARQHCHRFESCR